MTNLFVFLNIFEKKKFIKISIIFLFSTHLFASEPRGQITETSADDQQKASYFSNLDFFKIGGEWRTIYQYNSNIQYLDGSSGTSNTGVTGGKLTLKTLEYHHFTTVFTLYGTLKILGTNNSADGDYLNNGHNNDNYALLGQSFLRFDYENSFCQIGRFELDTPLLNSDDIRMIPDLYQGVYANISLSKKINLKLGYINGMAGWENGSDNSNFENIGTLVNASQTSSILFGGLIYADDDAPVFGRMFSYYMPNILDELYIDGGINFHLNTIQFQYLRDLGSKKLATYNAIDPIDSVIYGLSWSITNASNNLSFGLAYNLAQKHYNTQYNGGTADYFGGANDPFFTSMDVLTAHQIGGLQAYKAETSYQPSEKLSLDLGYAFFQKNKHLNNHETDLSFSYTLTNKTTLEGMFSQVDTTDDTTGKMTANNRIRFTLKMAFD